MDHQTLLGAYHYCCMYHAGQNSREYRVLSRILRVYSPGRSEQLLGALNAEENEQARAVYLSLVASGGHGDGEWHLDHVTEGGLNV